MVELCLSHCPLKIMHFDVDVNECLSNNGGCEQICTNREGSFECSCNPGFTLNSDGFTCDSKL